MSQLRDEVVEALQNLEDLFDRKDENETGTGIKHLIPGAVFGEKLPHWEEWSNHCHGEVIKILRRQVRFYGGASWETPLEAARAVMGTCREAFAPLALTSLAEGVVMGRKPIPVIRKYVTMHQVEDLFDAEGFQTEVAIHAMRLREDADLWQGLRNYVGNAFYLTGSASGFANPTAEVRLMGMLSSDGDEASEMGTEKIFDLWGVAMTTVCASLYAAGFTLGGKWEEQETFEAIMTGSQWEEPQ